MSHLDLTGCGHRVAEEEIVLLEQLMKARTKFATGGSDAARALEAGLKGAKGAPGAVVGSAILRSAILGWYVAM